MSSTASDRTHRPRILIVRLSAIGDVILTLPILNALRDHFPQAWLAWAVEGRAASLLEGHEALDELIVLPRGFLKSPRRVWDLRRRLRAGQFDAAIDVQGLSKSALVAWLSGAKQRIGFRGQWGREISPWLNNDLVRNTNIHVIERNLELLRPLGIERPEVNFRVPIGPQDRADASRFISEAGLDHGFAIINPGAGWPSKLWPPERFAAVARHLGEKWNLPTMVAWAGTAEQTMAWTIIAGSAGNAQLAPATSLRQLAALAQRARLFIGADTGPLHLAEAVGTPCLGLYGPWPAEETGPYGPRHIAVQNRTLQGSSRRRRHASPEYMESIDVPMVCTACDELLRRPTSRAA